MPKRIVTHGAGKVRLQEYDLPELGPEDVRCRARVTGISHGTETFAITAAAGRPRPLGYSAVGIVTDVGPSVRGTKPGERVFAYAPHSTEFQRSEDRCFPLPDSVADEHGQFAALLAVAYNGVMEARLTLGETVAVFGLGTVGQLTCQLARRAGARRVIGIEPLALRREVALQNGADGVIDPLNEDVVARVHELNDGEDADCAIETSGVVAGLNAAMKVVREQSSIICLSLYRGSTQGLDLAGDFHYKRLKLRVAQSTSVHPELMARWTHERRMRIGIEMLPSLRLDNLITHRFRLEQAEDAYRVLMEQTDATLQIVFLCE